MEDELNTLKSKIAEKKNELKILIGTGHIAVKRQVKTNAAQDDDLGIQSAMNLVTEEQYNQTTTALLQTEMETLETQADLDAAQEQLDRIVAQQEQEAQQPQSSEQLEAQIREEFQNDRDAAPLIDEINAAKEELEKIKRKAVQANDPATRS